MGFQEALRRSNPSVTPGNDTSVASITQLPVNILEAFIPGYSLISKFLSELLGFDITILVSVCFLIFALFTSLTFVWKHAYDQFSTFFMSSISVDSNDDIYAHVMGWIAGQEVSRNSRSLMAVSAKGTTWDMDGKEEAEDEEIDPTKMFNFSNWDAKIPPRFEPYFGQHVFWHKGHLFLFFREVKQVITSSYGQSQFKEDEVIRLRCIGRSTQPIKDLISEARNRFLEKEKSLTVIRRPSPKEQRHFGGRNLWTRVATRPSRPMETVVLDHAQKDSVLHDINEYLHPSTPRWYANRGIPYRRGYLFHGPPGTGKTSLSFAIAGIFGLDIYVISLLEPTLSEEDLGQLFNGLPRRCVVLLEDIDSAGLMRKDLNSDENQEKLTSTANGPQWGIVEVARAMKLANENDEKNGKNKGISLSGLLNAIDGVASHEGRVLVMTTNHPEKLDDALIRPGRVDMQVQFGLATRGQIEELFVRMYSHDKAKNPKVIVANGSTEKPLTNGTASSSGSRPSSNATSPVKTSFGRAAIPIDELETIAIDFAQRLPGNTFTPAEIQGFLLMRKKDPYKALQEVEEWRDALMEAKAQKSKVVKVQ
ncbi:MAG: hypothetical protein M1827_000396 [Pycnora praestabilis]|nr:MAG: hypothetical protein M1827_000396 [Pycnora praestabilis]